VHRGPGITIETVADVESTCSSLSPFTSVVRRGVMRCDVMAGRLGVSTAVTQLRTYLLGDVSHASRYRDVEVGLWSGTEIVVLSDVSFLGLP
jgi:hypothetical protein